MSLESTSANARTMHLEPYALPGKPARRDVAARVTAANASILSLAAAAPDVKSPGFVDDVLPRNDFLAQVRREIRRTERSGSPLSLLCFRMGAAGIGDDEKIDSLIEALYRSKRETDLVGHVGDDLIAVLCPDTTGQGSCSLKKKVIDKAGIPGVEAEMATFPDDLFEILGDNGERSAAVDPFLTGDMQQSARNYWLKRPLDILFALVALAAVWPLMLLVAVAIRLDSEGPVLFKQQRLGRHGKTFSFLKFRSMCKDNDDSIHRAFVAELIKARDQPDASRNESYRPYKLQRDPRITRVGKFIRRTSIDELPQLWNVLRGDMSLVGPRPPIAYETKQYRPWHLRRVLAIKPGITGLWQVQGRSRVTFDEMVRMDLRYIRECSLVLDLKLLIRTVAVVLRCDGAV